MIRIYSTVFQPEITALIECVQEKCSLGYKKQIYIYIHMEFGGFESPGFK